ncbi:tyrosinase family protein [Streptomyces albipurpureus]|uniref:Tyrosinase family protein n=1 Tax=Streptomyces albipurpureus TaxID=2897419 RepID=A0ABT0UM60_9ACTN|nr:tyrosinase family protein [Streptomyces sp. CWNU-1]MCM2389195.1 tyrosinase family protein [Streptomyces sp. CWNU-1]
MYTRKNQRNLTRTEKRRLVDALLELKRSGRYDEFVRMHGEYYVPDAEDGPRAAHMTPSFFPWHRAFLLDFERALQKVDPGVSIPYWDWTVDNSPASSLWADDFLGGTGRVGDRQVMSGPFAHSGGNWPINSRVTDGRYLTRNLGRPSDPVSLPTKEDVAAALDAPVYDAEPWDSTVRTGFRNLIEGWTEGGMDDPVRWRNHNRVHRWVGGLMLGATSPNDPVFWLHHSYMDLLWLRWQSAHPDADYLPRTKLPASDPQSGRVFALDEPLPPWQITPAELLDHTRWYRYA